MMGRAYATGRMSYHVQIDRLQELVDVKLLETQFLNIDKSQLTEREIEQINLFFLSLESQRGERSSNGQDQTLSN